LERRKCGKKVSNGVEGDKKQEAAPKKREQGQDCVLGKERQKSNVITVITRFNWSWLQRKAWYCCWAA
jgi:hypothetical protein